MRRRWSAVLVVGVLLATALPAGAQDGGDAPPAAEHRVVNILPPGQSGFVSVAGQARGQITGDPGDYGDHLDDQREPYWNLEYKEGGFFAQGDAEEPTDGVRIYRDEFGVPAIYGDTGRDVWFGAGYAVAKDRLFLMDAVRRMGRGTFAELTGPSGVPGDIQQRTLTYSDAEYEQFFDELSQRSKDAIEGYVEGANAWIERTRTNPELLPAEYALLTTVPEKLTVVDVLAAGVLITRTVAADGGNEFANVRALRALEDELGTREGRGVFNDFVWQDDPRASVTVPDARFSNQPGTRRQREDAFEAMADYAAGLPLDLEKGPGTGDAPEPELTDPPDGLAAPAQPAAVAAAVEALHELRAGLHGGSKAIAVSPDRTATGEAMLVSGPQLGYSYPSLLVELEVHGGGYDARGVSVPALPTVGIGYGKRVAWALTTGYSKTIDSFIETTRDADGTPQYRHQGSWKDQQCRTETIRYRAAVEGVPAGPPALETDAEICRTVHGPVVAATEDGARSRAVQYAMFKRELQTIEGVLDWNRAGNLEEFAAGVAKVTWNENVAYADADGHIGYWHPGLYPRRDRKGDQRLPLPGTGGYDHDGHLPFDRMPHSIDPEQGYLANWNNKPAAGWLDGEGISPTSRPAGRGARVTSLDTRLRRSDDLTFAALQRLEQQAGLTDHRFRELRPLLRSVLAAGGLGDRQRDALRRIDRWDGIHAGKGVETEERTDGVAATIFNSLVEAIRDELFDDIPDFFLARQSDMASHVYDVSAADNLALRVLRPASSGLKPSRDYTGGRSSDQVVRAALRVALDRLEEQFGTTDLDEYRRQHPRSDVCSLTGGIIGPCLTMPYQDRGSYIHVVAFGESDDGGGDDDPDTGAGAGDDGEDRRPALPATGGGAAALLGVLAMGAALLLLRRRPPAALRPPGG